MRCCWCLRSRADCGNGFRGFEVYGVRRVAVFCCLCLCLFSDGFVPFFLFFLLPSSLSEREVRGRANGAAELRPAGSFDFAQGRLPRVGVRT